jgi:lysophospholipase D
MIFLYILGWLTIAHGVLIRCLTCLRKKSRLRIDNILHKNKIWPLISAHRGGSYEYTENTLQAFKHAINIGSNFLECDVHITKDLEVVISHDENLYRLCEVYKNISHLNYDKLPTMSEVIPMHFSDIEYTRKPEETGKFTKLSELFEIAPDRLISVDLKADSDILR